MLSLVLSFARYVNVVVLFLPDCNSILSVSYSLRVSFGCLGLTMVIDRCCLRLLLFLLACFLIARALFLHVPSFSFYYYYCYLYVSCSYCLFMLMFVFGLLLIIVLDL